MRIKAGTAVVLWTLTGCVAGRERAAGRPGSPPEPAKLQVCLASSVLRMDYTEMTDESGQRVYVSSAVELDNSDVAEARALHSHRRSMLLLTLNHTGARHLRELTREHVGACLAIIVDDKLICAPPIYGPDASGQIRIVGALSGKEVERLAEALNQREQP
jgi:preprotein translocase subunit SecD